MPVPPVWFVNLLHANHPLLRVRWGSAASKFVIDQKGVIGPTEVYYLKRRKERLERWVAAARPDEAKHVTEKTRRTLVSVSEELTSALDGRRVIVLVDTITQQVYDAICAGEHARYGGYARFADAQEQREEAEDAERERVAEQQRYGLHSETYDQVDFMTRKKQAELQAGHRDLGYLLHGKRSDSPLMHLTDF